MPPRKTKNSRRKEVGAPSAASKKAITAIAEEMEEDSIESLLDDFDIQTEAAMKQALKQFEKEAKLIMTALPMKSSIPREILKMDVSEFIKRGGSFKTAWESLKEEKYTPAEPMVKESSAENEARVESGPMDTETQENMFVTPAMNTRNQQARLKRGKTTAKRRPKPLEEIKVQAYSNASGSPVDEKELLQLHSDELLVDIQGKIMETAAKFPQKWRSKLIQTFREMKAQAGMKDDVLVTPAVRR